MNDQSNIPSPRVTSSLSIQELATATLQITNLGREREMLKGEVADLTLRLSRATDRIDLLTREMDTSKDLCDKYMKRCAAYEELIAAIGDLADRAAKKVQEANKLLPSNILPQNEMREEHV